MSFAAYLRDHPAGAAATVREAPAPQPGTRRNVVAEYPRGAGPAFHVVHDPLAHPPYGLFRVYVADVLLGSQLSFPSRDDCARIDRPMRYGEASRSDAAEQYARMQALGKRRGRRLAEAAERRRATGAKPCAMCRKVLELSHFSQLGDGRRHSYCNPCRTEREMKRHRRAQNGAGSPA